MKSVKRFLIDLLPSAQKKPSLKMSAGNVTDLQCGERKSIKDDDSVISDRCWQEIHRGDSRKWLIRDASRQKMDATVCSTMKSSYLRPFHENRDRVVGIRRYLLKKQLYEQMKAEVIIEENQQPPVEEYCTEYDGNFNAAGFQPAEEEYNVEAELVEKYPLYSSPAASFWHQTAGNLQGATKVSDCTQPFRKNFKFSKPISEVLDE